MSIVARHPIGAGVAAAVAARAAAALSNTALSTTALSTTALSTTALPTTLPTPAPMPPTAGPGEPAWHVAVLVVWAAVGLAVAIRLGAAGRRTIAGPDRLGPDESAWPLVSVIAAALGAYLFAAVTASALLHRHPGGPPPSDLATLAAQASVQVVLAALILVMVALLRPGLAGLGIVGLTPRRLPAGVAGGAATLFVMLPLVWLAGAVVQVAYHVLRLHPAAPHPVLRAMGANHRLAVTVLGIVAASVAAPVAEELFFRGLIQTTLGRLFNWALDQAGVAPHADPFNHAPPDSAPHRPGGLAPATPARPAARWAAVVVTSAAFAAVHFEPAFLLPIFVLALGLGYAYERSANLWLTMVAHALFNTAQIVLFLSQGN